LTNYDLETKLDLLSFFLESQQAKDGFMFLGDSGKTTISGHVKML
jgi:hypothetical protein